MEDNNKTGASEQENLDGDEEFSGCTVEEIVEPEQVKIDVAKEEKAASPVKTEDEKDDPLKELAKDLTQAVEE